MVEPQRSTTPPRKISNAGGAASPFADWSGLPSTTSMHAPSAGPSSNQVAFGPVHTISCSRQTSHALMDNDSSYYSRTSGYGGSSTGDLLIRPAPMVRAGHMERHDEYTPLDPDSDPAASTQAPPPPGTIPHAGGSPSMRAQPAVTLRAQPFSDNHLQAIAMGQHMPTIITTEAALFQSDPVEEMIANYNMTKAIQQHMRDRKVWHTQQLQRLNEAREAMAAAQAACYKSVENFGGLLTRPDSRKTDHSHVNSRTSRRPSEGASRGPSRANSRRHPDDDDNSRPSTAPETTLSRTAATVGGAHGHEELSIQTEGAYLAFPDYSFSGTRPMRGVPERGVFFEKYPQDTSPPSIVQNFYLRPITSRALAVSQLRESASQSPPPRQRAARGLSQDGRDASPSAPPRTLPNGIPRARLEHLSAQQEQGRSRASTIQRLIKANAMGLYQAPSAPGGMTLTQTTTVTLIGGGYDLYGDDVPASADGLGSTGLHLTAEMLAPLSALPEPYDGLPPVSGASQVGPGDRWAGAEPGSAGASPRGGEGAGDGAKQAGWQPALPAIMRGSSEPGITTATPAARPSVSAGAAGAQAGDRTFITQAGEDLIPPGPGPREAGPLPAGSTSPGGVGKRLPPVFLAGAVQLETPVVKSLLDDSFFEAMREHFKEPPPLVEQTLKLRSNLNASLPSIMQHISGTRPPAKGIRAQRVAAMMK